MPKHLCADGRVLLTSKYPAVECVSGLRSGQQGMGPKAQRLRREAQQGSRNPQTKVQSTSIFVFLWLMCWWANPRPSEGCLFIPFNLDIVACGSGQHPGKTNLMCTLIF